VTEDPPLWSSTVGSFTAIYLRTAVPGKKIPRGGLCAWLASFVLLPRYMQNRNKKILIVDESDACRGSLGASLKGLGYEVFEATTGLEAIDKAFSVHPDLIMMDLRLPGINGDEATARIKRNVSTRNIPVLISTAWTTACNVGDRASRALDAGAAEILYKPFHLTMLRDVLRTYLLA
jgi:two-component system, cell cycle response regulator DivK